MITLTINGESRKVPEGSVLNLLSYFKLDQKWTLVELNHQVVERDKLDETILKKGDTLEIVRAVAGG